MDTLLAILQVAIGLGLVIFVHELGHFLVAKACGVRCDKFFIGFDIGGLKLSRKWGETEYGIGVLPLGGYVKMFGQEDNAGAIAEEIASSKVTEGDPDAKPIRGPGGETVWVHKRSYLAKSVPQRMAIISAGVIMNVLFAILLAFIAYGVGVPTVPAAVGSTVTGGPAWKAGLGTGDRLVRINDIENPSFEDLSRTVILGDLSRGVECVVERPDGATEQITLLPEKSELAPQVGIGPTNRLRLPEEDFLVPHTPAAAVGDKGFAGGDQVVEIDGEPVATFAELTSALEAKKEQPVTITVVRGGKAPLKDPFGPLTGGERVSFEVGPNPRERLGIIPVLGPVAALQREGPAEQAGLQEGDTITALDGVAIGAAPDGDETLDPTRLEDRLLAAARRGESVTLGVDRDGAAIDITVPPRVNTARTGPSVEAPMMALDSIGAAVVLESQIAAIQSGSPAADADLRPGDRIKSVRFVPDDEASADLAREALDLSAAPHWPTVLMLIQDQSSGFVVELEIQRPAPSAGAESEAGAEPEAAVHTVKLTPKPAEGEYSPTRGFALTRLKQLRTADSLAEQAELAVDETFDQLTAVLSFLRKIGGQVSVKALGGPIEIAKQAGYAAFEGFGSLLMMLVMLNANLAILNFLPIPVLDGGHMVFLLWEGITGRPVNDKVAIALQTVGLLLLLSLMLFVTSNDIMRLF
ncbi:site-2 protease family protein [Botrimarina sp.]|uniref:site-2 protease family protein n=1 Tax=Botrimarina sp. TaxID=2795802 RepID=UPI0032ED6BE9